MTDKRLLLVEDDIISAKMLQDSLASLGFQVTHAENGRNAMEYFSKNSFPIVVTDYDMPEMNGSQLIDFLNEEDEKPIVLVLTNHYETSLIIDIMKKGVYDYLIKPIDANELSIKLNRALEIYNIRRLDQITKREREIRLEGHLDWAKWKERAGGSGNFKNLNQNLFENLKTSFNQGTGFGALVTLLKIVSESSVKEGDFYKIDATLMDLIQSNNEMAEKALSTFSEIEQILNGTVELTKVSVNSIYDEIQELVAELVPTAEIKKQSIYLSERKITFEHFNIKIKPTYLKSAIKEIITNACKF